MKALAHLRRHWPLWLSLLISLVVFRQAVLAYPAILSGQTTLTTEELVPITDLQTQFIDQLFDPVSPLTAQAEFRVRYAWLTSWLRLDWVLPGALVLLNALSLYLIYRAQRVFQQRLPPQGPGDRAVAYAVSLVHWAILVYSKVTHFYTLIFGYALFVLTVAYLLSYLLRDKNQAPSRRPLWQALALTVFNPAVHYVVLAVFVAGLLWLAELAQALRVGQKKLLHLWHASWPWLAWLGLTVGLYGGYIYLAVMRPLAGSVESSVPISDVLIESTSVHPLQAFALLTGAQLDFHFSGIYLPAPGSRPWAILYSLPLFAVAGLWRRTERQAKRAAIAVVSLSALALFMSAGFDVPFSLHRLARSWFEASAGSTIPGLELLNRVLTQFFQILRFPHRFLFLYQAMAGFGLLLAWAWLRSVWPQRRFLPARVSSAQLSLVLLGLIVLPLAVSSPYAKTFASGNLGGFLQPFELSEDLGEIRDYVQTHPGQVAVFPTAELPYRQTVHAAGQVKLIDKFWLYQLNSEGIYYGSGSSRERKNQFFVAYQLLSEGKDWLAWLEHQRLDYLFVNRRQVEVHLSNAPALELEERIYADAQRMVTEGRLRLVAGGEDYQLYQLSERSPLRPVLYYNSRWQELPNTLSRYPAQDYRVVDFSPAICQEARPLIVGPREKTALDWLAQCEGKRLARLESDLPLASGPASSDNYISGLASLLTIATLPANNHYNLFAAPALGVFNTLGFQYDVLTTAAPSVSYRFTIERAGEYVLFLRQRSLPSRLSYSLKQGQTILLRESVELQDQDLLEGQPALVDARYSALAEQLELAPGSYTLTLRLTGAQSVAVDEVVLVDSATHQRTLEGFLPIPGYPQLLQRVADDPR